MREKKQKHVVDATPLSDTNPTAASAPMDPIDKSRVEDCGNCPDSSCCTGATDKHRKPEEPAVETIESTVMDKRDDGTAFYDDDDGDYENVSIGELVDDDLPSTMLVLKAFAIATLAVGISVFVLTRLLRDKKDSC